MQRRNTVLPCSNNIVDWSGRRRVSTCMCFYLGNNISKIYRCSFFNFADFEKILPWLSSDKYYLQATTQGRLNAINRSYRLFTFHRMTSFSRWVFTRISCTIGLKI